VESQVGQANLLSEEPVVPFGSDLIRERLIISISGAQMNDLEIMPREVKQRLDRGEKLLLVDVREPHEYAVCQIEGSMLIPMGTIPANLQKLDTEEEVICFCHHGMRSRDVVNWLRAQGIKSAKSMAGGIDRWSVEIDPKVPRY
jgi:adenylyltransferase/sulfurtransferase